MSEKNKALARKVFEDIQTDGNTALIGEVVTSDYVGHTPLGTLEGVEGAKQFEHILRTGFPDYNVTIEDEIAEGDKVAVRWTAHGTHNGEFQGVPPTSNQVEFSGLTIFRVANGKLVEGWSIPDVMGLMQQIGAVPASE